MNLHDIYSAIGVEIDRQHELHEPHKLDDKTALAVLVEEVGEVATEIITGNVDLAVIELTQVAAVCVEWIRRLTNDN